MSLDGLESIDPSSINSLNITGNELLSMCNIESVCTFLTDDMGNAYVYANAEGCETEDEIESSCLVSVEENAYDDGLEVFPNPTGGILNIKYEVLNIKNINGGAGVYLLNSMGNVVRSHDMDKSSERTFAATIDLSGLPEGIYLLKVVKGDKVAVRKIIKW
jgi:hypothetical protein